MKKPTTYALNKKQRQTREEINQASRERKRQKKHRGHAAGSRTTAGQATTSSAHQPQPRDSRIGSKKPVPLSGVTQRSPVKPPAMKSDKPVLSPQEELALLENDARLDALLERLEAGETLSAEEQRWLDTQLDRIDSLMQQLGLSYDDEENEEEAAQEDMMRLLKGDQG